MKYVVVEVVGDDAGAAVLVEALTAHQIPTELRRVPGTPYGPAKLEIEVRVPAERAADAQALLQLLAEDAEAAARRESLMVEPSDPDGRAPRRRPSTRWIKLAPARQRLLVTLGAAFVVAALLCRIFNVFHVFNTFSGGPR